MKKLPKIQSHFAYIDVKSGRIGLTKLVRSGHKIPIKITGVIYSLHSGDDGESREFAIDVTSAILGD